MVTIEVRLVLARNIQVLQWLGVYGLKVAQQLDPKDANANSMINSLREFLPTKIKAAQVISISL